MRRENFIMDMNHFITQNELSRLCSCEKQFKSVTLKSFFPENSLSNKIQNSNVFLKLDSNFVTKVKNLRGPQFKTFAHEKIEN